MKPDLKLLLLLLLFLGTVPTFGQSTVVTYQGRVTDNGTNFHGTGQFKAALVSVTNNNHTATATANPPAGGFITILNVTAGGNGYAIAPVVTMSGGGGSGATATATISGGVVTALTVNNPGSGYGSVPTVLLSAPPESLVFTTYWSNDGTSSAGSEPTAAVSAAVTGGLFNLRLGDTTLANMTALNASLFQQANLHLRLWFNNGVNGFAALSPTQPLTPTPYAAFANTAGSVAVASNQPVNLSVNGTNVLRLTLVNSLNGITANSVGGSPANVISNGFVGGFIGGGGSAVYPNRVGADFASVLGGIGNTASGFGSTAMGDETTASGNSSTAMGVTTTASGTLSTAMGYRARANHDGSFVWADYQFADFASTAINQFSIRAQNGLRLSDGTRLFLGGDLGQKINLFNSVFGLGIQSSVQYSRVGVGSGFAWYAGGVHNDNTYNAGGGLTLMKLDTGGLTVNGTFVSGSDRHTKENFAPVDPRAVLAKVAALPLSQWNYKADTGTRHLGPMAQDFYAAFGVGPDDKHIATVDADGVALAAIQGLNQKLEQTVQEKGAEIEQLKKRLDALEKMVRQTLTQGDR